jgi:hypothetical protein
MTLASGRCHYHPERPGLGICVECRNVICTECTTQFEGINRCAKCLAARLQKSRAIPVRSEWGVGNLFFALCSVGVLFGGVWLLSTLVAR